MISVNKNNIPVLFQSHEVKGQKQSSTTMAKEFFKEAEFWLFPLYII